MATINHLNIPCDVNIFQDFIVSRAHSNVHDFPMIKARRLNKLALAMEIGYRRFDFSSVYFFSLSSFKAITLWGDVLLKANQIMLSMFSSKLTFVYR